MNTAPGAVAVPVAGRVLWLTDTPVDAGHWMLERLARRAGLAQMPEVTDVATLTARTGRPAEALDQLCEGRTVVACLGPAALKLALGDTEPQEPWLFRRVAHRWGMVVPLLGPQQLLLRRSAAASEDEEDLGDEAPKPWRAKRVSWLKQNPVRFTGLQALRLRQCAEWARTALPYAGPAPVAYALDPPPADFAQWVDEVLATPELLLAFDLETDYYLKQQGAEDADEGLDQDQHIIRMSFAAAERQGVTVPMHSAYLGDVRRLLAGDNPKVGWNSWGFDAPVLTRNGYVLGGQHLDAQDAWHLLQTDLPKGLEFVSGVYTDVYPWKHLSQSNADLYAAMDADVTLRLWMALQDELVAAQLWEVYCGEVQTQEALARASRQGSVIDEPVRLRLGEEFRAALLAELHSAQTLVPPAFRREKLYARPPKGVEGLRERTVQAARRICTACGRPNINRKHACKVNPTGWTRGQELVEQSRWVVPCPPREAGLDALQAWLKKGNGFNPNSSDQLLAYMKAHKHPVGRNHKTEEESADTIHLKKLAGRYGAKHPIYAKTLVVHKIAKALSTYIEGYAPAADGCLHSVYHNGPATWRLASKSPNIQNVPKRKGNEWARQVRRMIVPRPGHVFVQCDSSSIEAVLVGYYMGDVQYVELAKQSIHAYVCCQRLGWPFTPETVRRVKDQHSALYEQIKTTVHGTSYGMGPYLMYMSKPDLFPSLQAAKDAQQVLFDALPGLFAWQHQIRVQAQREGKLTSAWGVSHHFYGVYTWEYDDDGQLVKDALTGLPKQKLGKDGKRCIAFLPQHSAGMFMRQSLRLLAASEWAPYMPAHVSVHDSLCLDVPEARAQEAAEFLLTLMTRPVPELGGLCIGAECEIGPNWLDMEFYATRPMLGANGRLGRTAAA